MRKILLPVMLCLFLASAYCSIPVPSEAALVNDWEAPFRLGASDSPYDPVIAMNSAGNAIAAWSNDGPVMARTYTVGVGWTSVFEVSWGYPNNAFPDVAIDAGGNATVVWLAWNTSPYDVLACRYVSGIGWDAPEVLCTLGYDPRVAMDDDGNIMVVYRKANGMVQNVWAARYDSTSGWEPPVLVQDGTADVDGLALAMDGSGNATAIWTEYTGTRYAVMAGRYTSGGNWSAPEQIDSAPYSVRWTLSIEMDSHGNAIASWNQYKDVYGVDIWANIYTAGVGWGGPELVEHSDIIKDASTPSVSMNDLGQAVVSWTGGDWGNGTVYDTYVSCYEAGVGWSPEMIIEDDYVNPAYDGCAVIDDLGQVVVVWYTNVLDPFGIEVRSTRSVDRVTWEDAVVVSYCSPYHGMSLQLAGDGHGSAIAVWYDDGANAARYVRPEYYSSIMATDDAGAPKDTYVQGQQVYVNVFVATQSLVPANVSVTVSLVTMVDYNETLLDSFTVSTSDPLVGWYISSEALVVRTLSTEVSMDDDEQVFDVVVTLTSTGYELDRTSITVLRQGLRFDPPANSPHYVPMQLVNVTLFTPYVNEFFYVQIVNSTDSVQLNWTWQSTADGIWETQFVVPAHWPTGDCTMKVRDHDTDLVLHSSTFSVVNSPPTADAGSDRIVTQGEVVSLDGSGSTDDGGVVNWTWSFQYGAETIELWGPSPVFQFDDTGTYVITLTVRDAASSTATDTMTVTVEAVIPEFGSVLSMIVSVLAIIGAVVAAKRSKGPE